MMSDDARALLKKPAVQAGVLLGTLVLALLSNLLFGEPGSPLNFLPILFAILIVAEIAYFVGSEVKEGAEKHGWKHEVVDTVIALAIALGIWFGASFLLNTSSPISAVVSCSMLPNLQRGDFVLVQGAPVKAYRISMSQGELDSLAASKALITYPGGNASIYGSIYPYCLNSRQSPVCQAFIQTPESVVEEKGAFTYRYERCPVHFQNGTDAVAPCLKSVEFKGEEYLANFSNDVVVYQPPQGDLYSAIGDIVHRVMFQIDVDGKQYYLTRGDNNPLLDMQVYDYSTGITNHPIPQDRLRGKVIGRIPLLGYFKLFLSGYFQEDAQCRTQLEFTHI
jgi:signal peptidase I